MYDLIVQDATVIGGLGSVPRVVDIGVENGTITYVGDRPAGGARTRISALGKRLIPGVIDGHVHFRSPGHPHKEDWASGSRAAASGGVTTVLDMPNTSPPTLTRADWEHKAGLAREHSRVNYGIWVGAAAGNNPSVRDLMDPGDACGIKVFMGASTGPLLVDDATLVRLFEETTGLIGVHAEDEAMLVALRSRFEDQPDPGHHICRPPEVAAAAVARLIELVEAHRRPVHICHVSTALETALLAPSRGRLPITTEACPHHLFLAADAPTPSASGNRIKVNPPVRGASDVLALWAAVHDHRIDTIGSDHAPHTLEEKALPYWVAPAGIPGVETTLPLLLTAVRDGRLSLEHVVELCSVAPARIFGLTRKGHIAVGYDADFVLLDDGPLAPLRAADLLTRVGWSPFEGMPMVPKPDAVYVLGQLVAERGMIVGDGVRGQLAASLPPRAGPTWP